MKTILAILAILAPSIGSAALCGPRDGIIEQLVNKYEESRKSIGMNSGGNVMELYASSITGTWTLIFTNPRKTTCILSSGDNFETVNEPLPKKDPT